MAVYILYVSVFTQFREEFHRVPTTKRQSLLVVVGIKTQRIDNGKCWTSVFQLKYIFIKIGQSKIDKGFILKEDIYIKRQNMSFHVVSYAYQYPLNQVKVKHY